MNKHRSFSLQSHLFEKALKPSDSKYDLDIKLIEKSYLEGLKSVVSKEAHQKSDGVS